MTLEELITNKGFTIYSLSKKTKIPYSTLNDLVKGKTRMMCLSFKYGMSLCDALDVQPNYLLEIEPKKPINRVPFNHFRSNVLHDLKSKGPKEFVNFLMSNHQIDNYHKSGYKEETLYLIALIDTLCKEYDLPKYTHKFKALREHKLDNPFYPGSVHVKFSSFDEYEKTFNVKCLDEFKKFNIIESSIDDAL